MNRVARIIGILCTLACVLAPPSPALTCQARQLAQADERELDAEGLEEFKEEVDEYIELRRRLDKKLLPLEAEASPESVHAYEIGLAKLIAAARARAEEGDLFVSEVRPLVRRLIREALTGPEGRVLRDEIYEEAPRKTFRIRINTRYPSELPVSSVPYSLLGMLPPLPAELEYRFVGRDLVLLDTDAQIVVDVLRDVVPR